MPKHCSCINPKSNFQVAVHFETFFCKQWVCLKMERLNLVGKLMMFPKIGVPRNFQTQPVGSSTTMRFSAFSFRGCPPSSAPGFPMEITWGLSTEPWHEFFPWKSGSPFKMTQQNLPSGNLLQFAIENDPLK